MVLIGLLYIMLFLVIPKANSVFTVEMEDYRIKMFGNQLRVRSAERSSKKFKSKPTTDL